jgi:prolyl oligopeptidase
VVAAAATQRPDLFKAVVPVVAPTDMIRFEKFTVGHWHVDEYGTVADSASFCRLKNYSPYHKIKKNVNYPSMLVVTSENDDRVPPFHSYKFVAKLQNRNIQTSPILLKVQENAGHSGGHTYSSRLQYGADVYSFIMHELGME